ncbi:hypothetical protein, partial [Pseudomonas aeruginosa]
SHGEDFRLNRCPGSVDHYREREPFMEISVSKERKIEFVFYSRADNFSLSSEEFYEIYGRAEAFLPQALENEDSL